MPKRASSFQLVQANFNPTRQLPAPGRSPRSSIPGANPFNLYTAQVTGVVQPSTSGGSIGVRSNRFEAQADTQRFQVEAAYLSLTSNVAVAAITEASLRGQIDAANELISINTKMLDILRRQLNTGYASRNDVALQEAALAQVERDAAAAA